MRILAFNLTDKTASTNVSLITSVISIMPVVSLKRMDWTRCLPLAEATKAEKATRPNAKKVFILSE